MNFPQFVDTLMMAVKVAERATIRMTFVARSSLRLSVPAFDAVHEMGRLAKLPVAVQEILPIMKPKHYATLAGTEFVQRMSYLVESAAQLAVTVTTMAFGHLHMRKVC